jgi:hypothetical protein
MDSNKEPGKTVGKKFRLALLRTPLRQLRPHVRAACQSVIYLLFVVNDYVLELFTFWSGPVQGDGAAFAIG